MYSEAEEGSDLWIARLPKPAGRRRWRVDRLPRAEELTEQAHAVELDAFHVVSVVLEQPIGNPAVIVMADLPFSRAGLAAQAPSHELDASSLVQAGGWHPTARYRVLVAIAHFFGEGAAAEALSGIAR